jgi:hypothetical protein
MGIENMGGRKFPNSQKHKNTLTILRDEFCYLVDIDGRQTSP